MRPMELARLTLPPLGVNSLFYLLSPYPVDLFQWVLALVLLQIPWFSYSIWVRRGRDVLPIFAIVSFMYWVYYVVALFWGSRTLSTVWDPVGGTIHGSSLTLALVLCLLGVSFLWLGIRVDFARYLVPKRLPQVTNNPIGLHYVRVLLVAGGLLGLSESLPYAFTEGGRQAVTVLISLLPLVAFAILLRNWMRGEAPPIDKVLIIGFLVLRFLGGVASGWLGAFASVMIVCGAIYISERRKMPRLAVVLVIAFTLFFQVGKTEFRKTYWHAETANASKLDRVTFWTETSLVKWRDALSDPTGDALKDALDASLSRVSLLTQTANVIDMTPAVVPYQNGDLYSFLLITWIPRALWPGKPSVNEANQFYQVAYGLSTEEDLANVSISIGVATEAYINFGWIGVAGIMFLIGIFFNCYQRMFFGVTSGQLMSTVGIVLLPQVMGVESQMAIYLGGIVQQVVFTLLLMLPILRYRQHIVGRKSRQSLPAGPVTV